MVQAVCAIYTTMLQICFNPYVRLYILINFEMAEAAWVQILRGETWDGRGVLLRVYFKKGR